MGIEQNPKLSNPCFELGIDKAVIVISTTSLLQLAYWWEQIVHFSSAILVASILSSTSSFWKDAVEILAVDWCWCQSCEGVITNAYSANKMTAMKDLYFEFVDNLAFTWSCKYRECLRIY